jgi:hypothetical protein
MATQHKLTTELPFLVETALEARSCVDPEWLEDVVWGTPRPGHCEGQVRYHIGEVLANVDRSATSSGERRALRLISLVQDTFKYRVDPARLRTGANYHATIARKFAERYIDVSAIREIIDLHDEAYNSWRLGAQNGRWDCAEARALARFCRSVFGSAARTTRQAQRTVPRCSGSSRSRVSAAPTFRQSKVAPPSSAKR